MRQAILIISLLATSMAFAAKPDCETNPTHPKCGDDGGGRFCLRYGNQFDIIRISPTGEYGPVDPLLHLA